MSEKVEIDYMRIKFNPYNDNIEGFKKKIKEALELQGLNNVVIDLVYKKIKEEESKLEKL